MISLINDLQLNDFHVVFLPSELTNYDKQLLWLGDSYK